MGPEEIKQEITQVFTDEGFIPDLAPLPDIIDALTDLTQRIVVAHTDAVRDQIAADLDRRGQ